MWGAERAAERSRADQRNAVMKPARERRRDVCDGALATADSVPQRFSPDSRGAVAFPPGFWGRSTYRHPQTNPVFCQDLHPYFYFLSENVSLRELTPFQMLVCGNLLLKSMPMSSRLRKGGLPSFQMNRKGFPGGLQTSRKARERQSDLGPVTVKITWVSLVGVLSSRSISNS